MDRRRLLLANSHGDGAENLIENKCTLSYDRLDRLTFTFDFPVESDIVITYYIGATMTNTCEIKKGETASVKITDAVYTNPIKSITPAKDNVYIYTW